MDIIEQLWLLQSNLQQTMPESAAYLRMAIDELQANRNNLARIPVERFDRFFAAALQGLLGRATAATLMDGNASLVKRARAIATLCVQAQPGEDP